MYLKIRYTLFIITIVAEIVAENMALRASNTTLLAVDQASVRPAGNRVNLGEGKS